MKTMQKVGIVGGSGFIGSYVSKKFLSEDYYVRVGVTDLSNQEKYAHLKSLPNASNLELVQLDVRDENNLQTFMRDCEIVVHGGTPFQLDFEDPQRDLIEPTMRGTENFLNLVQHQSELRKIVFVASVAAYNTDFPMSPPENAPDHVISEVDPPHHSHESHPYAQGKYFADQAVRKYIAEHPDLGFEIASVSPVFVVGKPLSGRQDSTSVGMQYLFKNKIAPNDFVEMLYANDVEFAVVDVEDVAESIYRVAASTGNHGRNYLLTSESWRISDLSLMLNKQEPVGSARTVYSNALASSELGISFNPAKIPLNAYD